MEGGSGTKRRDLLFMILFYMAKKLQRDEETKMVAGVLGGLARYFEQDPTIFRLVAIFFILITGVFPGVLMYIIAWFVVPRRPTPADADYTIVQ